MYDELIEELRLESQNMRYGKDDCELFAKAADAIEELSRDLNDMNEANIALYGALPKWIPVTERLPQEDGCYLVAVKNDHKRRYSKTAWFSHDSWFARQDVTHWMPLPTPPKEEVT